MNLAPLVTDIARRRLAQATLDDVFLQATGHHLEVDKKEANGKAVAMAAGGAA